MTIKTHIGGILVLLLGLSSCTITQELDLPTVERKLAISGLASFGDIFVDTAVTGGNDLLISRVKSYANEEQDTIIQGSIVVRGGTEDITIPQLPFKSIFGYNYRMDVPWIPGETYSLEVDFPTYPQANCTFNVPPKVEILNLDIQEAISASNPARVAFEITLQDPEPNAPNFFQLNLNALHTDNEGNTFSNNIGWFIEDPLIQTGSRYVSDEIFVNGQYTFRQELDLSFLPFAPSFWQNWEFTVQSINQESFNYLEELNLHTLALDNDLFGQPKPLPGNIEGAEGFFGVVVVSADTIPWP
ncbi:MAG: DUF4249 domain-containing protein [Bacteroidia bacterium]|nr:DUF4249 domain-containing protein [Bacteroidia bacterium]